MADVEVQPYIVNGTSASVDTFPSMASLFIDATDFGGGYSSGSYCGATILSDRYILTAAHCIYGSELAQLFTVVVPQLQNENDFPLGNIQSARVSEVFYRSDYQPGAENLWRNDIAILKLDSALNIDSINGIANFADNENYRTVANSFVAVGHGNTKTGVDSSKNLLKTELKYVVNSTCANVSLVGPSLTEKQICFDGEFSALTGLSNATCQGDSGGPVYWNDGGTYKQVGLTSFGPTTCGDPTANVTSVFTEITDYKGWINSVVSGNETPKFVATDAKRQAFFDSSSGGGGGSLPLWSVFALGFIGLFRKQQR
ncbi:trypsin-like serine protease [Vibrio sp. 03-59-1]|uniref:S1 family peptidase n=1 Tax=Vibrio sp. 03-59-1 TaxID=2607607 RepID=UPI0020A48963|nr:trypsin-like serine protease [Vibrio sp. 03-59-1]